MDLTLGITIIAILISLSAFFGGIEVAFFSVTDAQVKQFFDENRKGSRALKRLREDPNHMLTTVMLSNNLVNIAAAAISTELAITRFGSAGVGIATGILISCLHYSGLCMLTHTPSPMNFLGKILDRPQKEKAYL